MGKCTRLEWRHPSSVSQTPSLVQVSAPILSTLHGSCNRLWLLSVLGTHCMWQNLSKSWQSLSIYKVCPAGIMALPRAVATLGVVPGALLILFVYVLSFITMDALSR